MAQIRAQLKRSILTSLQRQAGVSSITLSTALGSYQDALVNGVKGGRLWQSTSQAGHSTTFRVPQIGEHFRQEDVCELAQEYLEVYADALTTLITAGISSPTDAQILATMLADDRMQSVTTTRRDYTLVSYPNRF